VAALDAIHFDGQQAASNAIKQVEQRIVAKLGGPDAMVQSRTLQALDAKNPPLMGAPQSGGYPAATVIERLRDLKGNDPAAAKLVEAELASMIRPNVRIENGRAVVDDVARDYKSALGDYRKAMNAVRLLAAWRKGDTSTMEDLPLALYDAMYRRLKPTGEPNQLFHPSEMPTTYQTLAGENAVGSTQGVSRGITPHVYVPGLPIGVGIKLGGGKSRTAWAPSERPGARQLRGLAEIAGTGTVNAVHDAAGVELVP